MKKTSNYMNKKFNKELEIAKTKKTLEILE